MAKTSRQYALFSFPLWSSLPNTLGWAEDASSSLRIRKQGSISLHILALLLLCTPITNAWTNGLSPSSPLWFGTREDTATQTPPPPPSNVKLLVCPGFGSAKPDYFLNKAPEGSLVQSLVRRGWSHNHDNDERNQIRVLPIDRTHWLQVFAKGALDMDFWKSNAPPTKPAFRWYLDLIDQEIQALCRNEEDRVVLLGHSAGGWLARAALGFLGADNDKRSTFSLDNVLGLVTLGSPHVPPPVGVTDLTRGALRHTHETFPDTYHSDNLFYITVCGESVLGVEQKGRAPWEPATRTGFAYDSYEVVCGDGTEIGDGVVPIRAAHLTNATQIVIPGVLHSVSAPQQWYGSDAIIDRWHSPMLDAIHNSIQKTGSPNQPASWIPDFSSSSNPQ